MNISDHLKQAADEAVGGELDLHRVARVARHQGSRARRRRGAAVLGSAAAVAVVVAGSTALLAGGPGTGAGGGAEFADGAASVVSSATPSPTPVLTPTPSPDPRVPDSFTGRGVAAGLRSAVAAVADGRADAFAGQADFEAYGQLDWHDADGQGVSVVGINVQPGVHFVSSCRDAELLRCTRTRPTAGSTLTTYEEHTQVAGGVGIRRVADLLRADGTRVVVSATNGYDLPSSQWDVTRPQPPLDFAQLTAIVSRPWWGATLPKRFLAQGRLLAPYHDLDDPTAPAMATPTPSAG